MPSVDSRRRLVLKRLALRRQRARRQVLLTRGFLAKAALLATLTVLTALAFHSGALPVALTQVGDTWVGETLVAPESFAIDKSVDSLAAERVRARRGAEPIFVKVPDAVSRIMVNHDTLRAQLVSIMEAYRDYRLNVQRARLVRDSVPEVDYGALARRDSSLYIDRRQRALVFLSDDQWRILGDDFASRDLEVSDSIGAAIPGQPIFEYVLDRLWTHATAFARAGILDIPSDSVLADYIKIRDTDANTFERTSKNSVFGQERVYEHLEQDLAGYFTEQPDANVAAAFLNAVFVFSLQSDVAATERARDQAEQQVSSTRGMIAEDEIIVRKGELITPDIKQRLESLERKRKEGSGPKLHQAKSLGKVLLALCIFGIFFVYLFVMRRHVFDDNAKMLLVAILYAAIIGLFAIAVRRDVAFMFAVPTLIVSVVLTLVFDTRVGLSGTLVVALLGGVIVGTGHAFEFALATIVGGTLAVFTIQGARNRGQFFVSVASAFGGFALVFLANGLFEEGGRQSIHHALMAGVNSFLLIAAYPLLWVVERTFGVASELRLIELGDYNQPLLRKLQQEAAGTFNHSMQVANLAEAAAEAIGANALLTRVGALYHDIGKLEQPEYFVENQRSGVNPHTALSARQSAEIIRNHVTHGMVLAADYRLPGKVSEFIPMHHGTMRIEYFYHKAHREAGEGNAVRESDFRYSGPRPQSKEAGILMLTDGVEAACKSITEPSEEKFDERIEAVFTARIQDGQLDDSHLTFKDLKVIKRTFIKQLAAFYHVRVKYPGQK